MKQAFPKLDTRPKQLRLSRDKSVLPELDSDEEREAALCRDVACPIGLSEPEALRDSLVTDLPIGSSST